MANDEIDYQDLKRSMESLQSDIKRISSPYEDALSFRVFDNARKKMTIFLSILGGITIVGVAFFAFNIYTTVNTTVNDYLKNTLLPDLKREGEKQLKEKLVQTNLETQIIVDSQISAMTKTIEAKADIKLNKALEEIGNSLEDKDFANSTEKKIKKAVEKKKGIVNEGWSLFGIKNADNRWKKQIFLITDTQGKKSDEVPDKKDKIKVIMDVNLRSAPPRYSDELGWILEPIKSIIKYNEVVTVKQVKSIPTSEGGEYIWVQISRSEE